ncbi:unnamed protein product [Lota lota]
MTAWPRSSPPRSMNTRPRRTRSSWSYLVLPEEGTPTRPLREVRGVHFPGAGCSQRVSGSRFSVLPVVGNWRKVDHNETRDPQKAHRVGGFGSSRHTKSPENLILRDHLNEFLYTKGTWRTASSALLCVNFSLIDFNRIDRLLAPESSRRSPSSARGRAPEDLSWINTRRARSPTLLLSVTL